MSKQFKQDGFVMVVVLVLMLFFAVVAQRFSRQLLVNTAFTKVCANKEQARLLALSGIGISLAQIFKTQVKQEEQDQDGGQIKRLYKTILPKHHLWQTYELDKKHDGINGTIRFAVSCEDGKINLNDVYDGQKQTIKDKYKPLLEPFVISKTSEEQEEQSLISFLEEFFQQKNGQQVEDPSQLELSENFKVFYNPPMPKQEGTNSTKDLRAPVCDLFTVFGSTQGINPLLLSSTMRQALGFSNPSYTDEETKKEALEQVYSKISKSLAQEWKANFKSIESWFAKKDSDEKDESEVLYIKSSNLDEKERKNGLEKIENLLSKEIEPKFFTVLSCGEFKRVKQTVLAIVERQAGDEQKKPPLTDQEVWKGRKNFIVPPGFKIVRIYYGIDTL